MRLLGFWLAMAWLVIGAPLGLAADRPLADFADPKLRAALKLTKTTVGETLEAELLELRAEAAGGYPGVYIPAPAAGWDLSAFGAVAIELANESDGALEVALRVDNAGDWRAEPWSVAHTKVAAGAKATLVTKLGLAYDKPKTGFDPAKVIGVNLFVVQGKGAVRVKLSGLRATGTPASPEPVSATPAVPVAPARFVSLAPADAAATIIKGQAATHELVTVAEQPALRVVLANDNHWPGVTLLPTERRWNLSPFTGVQATVRNESGEPLRLGLRVDNPKADGNKFCNTEVLTIPPREQRVLAVRFGQSWGNPGAELDTSNIVALTFFAGKLREPQTFSILGIEAFSGAGPAPGAKAPVDPKRHSRVSTKYPATLDFEPPHLLFDLDGGELTTVASEVIAGQTALVGDSRGKERKWFEFFTTRPGLFAPGHKYTVRYRYRVLHAEPGAKAYALFRSHSQGWGRWDRSWTDFPSMVVSADQVYEGTLTAGLDICDDYQLLFGLQGEARVVIDEVRLEQGEPFTEPDPESLKIAAIPATAELVATVDFEEPLKGLWLAQPKLVTSDAEFLISGAKSYLMDSLSASGEWNAGLSLEPSYFPGGRRYHVQIKSKALAWGAKDAYAYIVVKRTKPKSESADIVWKRWRGMIGRPSLAYTSFDLPAGEEAKLDLAVFKKGQVLVDELIIKSEPLPPDPIVTQMPLVRDEAKPTWSDEFDGQALDTTKWIAYHEPRTGGWWAKDDAYLNGEGHLVLRFQRRADGYTFGAIHSNGKYSFTYGYVEARMKLPKQPGHWPGIWLMGNQVNRVGDGGRDGTEVDIVECPWRNRDRASQGLHWDGYGLDHQTTSRLTDLPGLNEGWHTYGVDWSPAGYIFYIDGKETFRTSDGGSCRVPLFIILSEEMGGWSGDPKQAKELPDYTYIDYIRVWQAPPQ